MKHSGTVSLQQQADPRPKNRVVGFSRSSVACAGSFASEPVELRLENGRIGTATVSGALCWLSKDPLSEEGADVLPQSRSLPCASCKLPTTSIAVPSLQPYTFCANDPLNYVDPLGLNPNKCCDFVDCMANCITQLNVLNNALNYMGQHVTSTVYGYLIGTGVPIPKVLLQAMGFRVIMGPGASPITNPSSTISMITRLGVRSWLRSVGAASTGVLLIQGSYMAGVTAGCAISCSVDPCSY